MPTPSTSEIRTWALKQGHAVGDRGRISATVVEAYSRAHQTSRPAAPAAVRPAKAGSVKGPKQAPRQAGTRAKASVLASPVADHSAARIANLEAQVGELKDRLTALEKAPHADLEQRVGRVATRQRRWSGRK